MNYLAHAYLSRQTPDALIGSLLGDFVKGQAINRYSSQVREAILLHRAIDRFTDKHPLTLAGRALVSAPRRRFAGVLVDVFYDHFLARHWQRYCVMSLEEFTGQVYAALWPRRAGFPERLQRILPYLVGDDWLASYGEVASVNAALNGIARRFRRYARAQVLTDAVCELEDNYQPLEAGFLQFFPELIRFSDCWRASAGRGCDERAA
jgi:acyl carrier protein phosphodiesterase